MGARFFILIPISLISLGILPQYVSSFSPPHSFSSSPAISERRNHCFQRNQQGFLGRCNVSNNADADVMGMLDGDQEGAIVGRARLEEELMSPMQEILLMANPEERALATKLVKENLRKERLSQPKASGGFGGGKGKKGKAKSGRGGGTGGFGGGSSTKSKEKETSFSLLADKSGFGAVLREEGVVRIDQAISPQTATDILKCINQKKLDTEDEVANGSKAQVESRFARVLLKKQRWDLLLPLEEEDGSNNAALRGLDELLGEGGIIGEIVEANFGLDAKLYEFASLISDPESERQVIHPDIPYQESVPLLTCFVALQDIDASMGATTFIPKSATDMHHKTLKDHSKRDGMLASTPNKLSLLNVGDCSLFDARTLHAGGANKSERRRCLFYFTFLNPSANDPRTSNNPGSIRPELIEQQITLRDLRERLALQRKKQ